MSDNEVTLTIDGKSVTVPKGTKVVDAAKQVDVDIPIFCYHQKIGPLGCCRMCLVEVEKMPKLMTACTMDVMPDMVVKTTTDKVEKAQKARKDGLLSLEADLPNMREGFFKNGIELAINERESSRLRTFLNLEMNNITSRHIAGQELFLYMGSYAPAFGMLGTVLGLIVMMNNFAGGSEEISATYDVSEKFAQLLSGMGLALITTFYGVFMANMIFLPIGGKLKRISENEMMLKNIVVEGIISIHAREHPLLIKEKLMTFVPNSLRPSKD